VWDFYGREHLRGPKLGMEEKLVNIEHTWPQSRMEHGWDGERDFKFNKGTLKGDLHNLFPTSEILNSARANKPFGEVGDCPPEKSCDAPDEFEVPDAHKGDAARAMFYFAVRYGQTIPDDMEATLRAWSDFDPPDDAERTRNTAIAARQGNTNPFIDDPALAAKIRDF
jgi:endonuclease I